MRYTVIELKAKKRSTGFGVWDEVNGWVCDMFMFADIGVARAEKAAREAAERRNAS